MTSVKVTKTLMTQAGFEPEKRDRETEVQIKWQSHYHIIVQWVYVPQNFELNLPTS